MQLDTFASSSSYKLLHYSEVVDECLTIANCVEIATCINSLDGFICHCPVGYTGDGMQNGTGCSRKIMLCMYL